MARGRERTPGAAVVRSRRSIFDMPAPGSGSHRNAPDVNRRRTFPVGGPPVTLAPMAQRASSGGSLDAAVLDSDERQSLVTVRSLGRLGLRVGAFDDTLFPPASTSRWCATRARLPDGGDPQRYIDGVLGVARRHRPRVVFTARDSTIEALRG